MTTDLKDLLRKSFTLKGRIFHPNLLVPKASKPGDREKFDVQFAWKNTENQAVMNEINQFMMQLTQIAHAGLNPAALVNPFKRFETYVKQSGKPNDEHLRDHIWINPSSGKDFPPQIVKQSQMGLVQLGPQDSAEVYSGRNAVINISFYVIAPKPGAQNAQIAKRGFGLNFTAVMLLEGGERLAGSHTPVDPNQIFGGFAQDMGMSAPQQNIQAPQPQQNNTQPNNNQFPFGNGGGFI